MRGSKRDALGDHNNLRNCRNWSPQEVSGKNQGGGRINCKAKKLALRRVIQVDCLHDGYDLPYRPTLGMKLYYSWRLAVVPPVCLH